MKTINEQIKKNELKHCYLLYGEEAYLRHQYRDKLCAAICPDGDDMNITRFVGKGISGTEVADIAETLPFFADRRVIIIEDSGWFKQGADGFEERLGQFPDTTYFIFVETEVDKRGKLYKKVKELGYPAEMKTPKAKDLMIWLVKQCQNEGKQLTEEAAECLLEEAGASMNQLQMELEKVISYALERDSITLANREQAVKLYQDLLALREPAMRILYLLTRQIHILLQVSELVRLQMDTATIASKVGIPPFTVGKYKNQVKHFRYEQLLEMLDACQETDAGIKQGRWQDTIGLELLIVQFSGQ